VRNARTIRGAVLTELALLVPVILILFLGLVQIVIYVQSRTVVQYAAFAAARAFQVYGNRTLGSIGYPHVRGGGFTDEEQTIAEAAAEKVIFEGLLWEHRRVSFTSVAQEGAGKLLVLDRVYKDGDQATYGNGAPLSDGAVSVDFTGCANEKQCGEGATGVTVRYCLPIVFPGIDFLFTAAKKEHPCQGAKDGGNYRGIMIAYNVPLAREPETM
jgi:hypothetical protein